MMLRFSVDVDFELLSISEEHALRLTKRQESGMLKTEENAEYAVILIGNGGAFL